MNMRDAMDLAGASAFVLCFKDPHGKITCCLQDWSAEAQVQFGDVPVAQLPEPASPVEDVVCGWSSDWQSMPNGDLFAVMV